MSIKLMAQIWEDGPSDGTDTLVLLAIADFANDAGECWPAMASIAAKSRMTERGARKVVRRLEAAGWLTIEVGGGRHGCSVYTVNPEPRSPRNAVPPEPECTKPGTRVQETRNRGSAEPPRTIKEPSVVSRARPSKQKPKDADQEATAILAQVVPWDAAADFVAHRRDMKKPMTARAAKATANKLHGHPDPAAVVQDSIANGWQGVFPEKIKAKGPQHEPRSVTERLAARFAGMDQWEDRDAADPFPERDSPQAERGGSSDDGLDFGAPGFHAIADFRSLQ